MNIYIKCQSDGKKKSWIRPWSASVTISLLICELWCLNSVINNLKGVGDRLHWRCRVQSQTICFIRERKSNCRSALIWHWQLCAETSYTFLLFVTSAKSQDIYSLARDILKSKISGMALFVCMSIQTSVFLHVFPTFLSKVRCLNILHVGDRNMPPYSDTEEVTVHPNILECECCCLYSYTNNNIRLQWTWPFLMVYAIL